MTQYGAVGKNRLIDLFFDQSHFLGRDGLVVAEVEAQAIRGHHAAGLFHVVAQHVAQGGMQKMGSGVVTHNSQPMGLIHAQIDPAVGAEHLHQFVRGSGNNSHGALFRSDGPQHVQNRHATARLDRSHIAYLPPGFRVERGAGKKEMGQG